MKKENGKLTISVNKSVKKKYKELCEMLGLKVGKQIELFMQEELKKIERESEK